MKYANEYAKLTEFGRELLGKNSLEEGLPFISKYIKEVINADRCSIFMNDIEKKELWTTLADGTDKITIPSNQGIIGETVKTAQPIMTNDAYSHPNFLPEVDIQTGYKTKNVITIPIFNYNKEVLGVLQLLNKEGGFDGEELKFMRFFAHYISGFLELINSYRDIKKHHHQS